MFSCLLPSAYCLLILVFILILVLVVILFCDDIEFDGIESHNFQLNSALFTFDHLTFVRVSIYMDFGFAFRARSGRHFVYLQNTMFSTISSRLSY